MHLTNCARRIFVAALCAVSACTKDSSGGQNSNKESKVGELAGRVPTTTGCDASLWSHVYEPARLQQVSPCTVVSGTVDESNADEDGDQHFLIKLDPGEQDLLVRRNEKKKSGDLVGEIVCANTVSLHKAKAACAGYTNSIVLPKPGERVRVTGAYVIDSHNGWSEIHPVSKLEKM